MAATVLLCLGSNLPDSAGDNIEKALLSIESSVGHIIASSGKYDTPCYHKGLPVAGARYLNEVVTVASSLDATSIDEICKDIEASLGRNADTRRAGVVPIDIDVIAHDGQIIRPVDFNSPYFIKGYKRITGEEAADIECTDIQPQISAT